MDSITDYVIVTVVFPTGYNYNKNKPVYNGSFTMTQFCFTNTSLPYSVLKWDGIGSLVSPIKSKEFSLGQVPKVVRPEDVEGLDDANSEWPI